MPLELIVRNTGLVKKKRYDLTSNSYLTSVTVKA